MNSTEYEPWSDGALSMESAQRFLALGRSKIFELMALGELEFLSTSGKRLICRRSAVEWLRRQAQQTRQEVRS